MNKVPGDVQNVALPPLRSPMRITRPPTTIMAPTNTNIFLPDVSENPQPNHTMDQPTGRLGPKSSSMPGQFHISNPRALQQQNQHRSNIPFESQLPITHPKQKVLSPPEPLEKPPP